ncbi:hypothetical protein F5141DRAFT_1030643 [Pisolithus sp. B1]|nr:hypothetical protein F5141DRAFT_1030643 [Pisolithus sp. B1]
MRLCFQIPIASHENRLLDEGAETFLKEDIVVLQNIPTIVVFTKYDKLVNHMAAQNKTDPDAAAKEYLQEYCIDPIVKLTGSTHLSCVAVSLNAGHERGRSKLIELTHEKVTAAFGSQLGVLSSASVVTQMAQRVSPSLKIEGSIAIGKQRYWRAPTDYTVLECLAAVHTDIVRVWNFNDPSQLLSSNDFREIMTSLIWTVGTFSGRSTPVVLPSVTGPALSKRVHGAFDVHHKFMAYIVHLVHVLEVLFALMAIDNGKKLTRGAISSALNAYYHSATRRDADIQIKGFDNETLRNAVLEKIVSLIRTSPIDEDANINALKSVSREDLERGEWYVDVDTSERRERLASLTNLINDLNIQFKKEGDIDVLTKIITFQRTALQLTPPGHQERVVSLVHLANSLHKRFRMEGTMEDLTEIITLWRAALQLTPQGHPRRVVNLVNFADSLYERFKKEGGMEDLEEIVTLRRAALQFTPPGHPGRFLSLVNLSNSLHERFIKGGTLADLDEIIAFRRAASECTAPTPSDQCMSLLNLADSLREKYQRLGMDADLAEAIKYARAASVRCPVEQDASCRDCIASCVELKAKKSRVSAPTVEAIDSGVEPSGIKQMVRNIIAEITQTLPLRLLNTYTGALCDRDAQISCFQDSAQYDELASTYDSPECEQSVRKTVSKYFGYTTLSHRWGVGEPLLRNIQGNSVYDLDGGEGFAKLQNFCALTLRHGYRWAWSDTCCIDKDSSSELQEAIGSMFSWYRNSALTIVHLSDVSGTTSFADSIWFKRGWTLQELLASPRVLFYTQDWSLYMSRTSPNHKLDDTILTELQEATGIGELQLKNFSPGVFDARSKLQWASTRHTTRAEDVAYSLFGIFQVSLPVIYGETTQGALGRLLAEIVSQSGDVSVLDWVGEASPFHSYFPASLAPYQAAPRIPPVLSEPSKTNDVDLGKKHKLYNALAQLQSPRFLGRRLVLPCIVHRAIRVKLLATSSTTSHYDYEIIASGLVPLKLTLSHPLHEGSGTLADLPYALVRPCDPNLLHLLARSDIPGRLLEWLGQPFNALLLRSLLHNEYRRIASDCLINASIEDLGTVVNIQWRNLEIV